LIRREKLEKFGILGEIFPNPNQRWLTRPNPSIKKLIQPRSKIFDPDPSLIEINFQNIKFGVGYHFTIKRNSIALLGSFIR